MKLTDINGNEFDFSVVRLVKDEFIRRLEGMFPKLNITSYYSSPTETVVIMTGKGYHINLTCHSNGLVDMHVVRIKKSTFESEDKVIARLREIIN